MCKHIYLCNNSGNKLEEYVVNLFPDESSEAEKFPVDSVQTGLEEISFSWIFAVKQI